VVPISGGNTERQIMALIMDFGARGSVPRRRTAWPWPRWPRRWASTCATALRVGVFGAEPWSDAMRREHRGGTGIKAFDIYGLSEIMGPGVACECEPACGLHGWEDHFLFETIDPDTGEPVPDGEEGELVITTLTKQACP
jgi:phenylacetate-CoA ligase